MAQRFVLPRGCSQAGMTNAGQTKQTCDITHLPIRPVCLPVDKVYRATQVVFFLCGERTTCPVERAPPHPPEQCFRVTQLREVRRSQSLNPPHEQEPWALSAARYGQMASNGGQVSWLQIQALPLTSCMTLGKQLPPWASVSSLVQIPLCYITIRQQLLPDSSLQRGAVSPNCPTMSYPLWIYSDYLVNTRCLPTIKPSCQNWTIGPLDKALLPSSEFSRYLQVNPFNPGPVMVSHSCSDISVRWERGC